MEEGFGFIKGGCTSGYPAKDAAENRIINVSKSIVIV
jgi:hypothetical protein